jgi:hypothetical protein
MKVFSAAALLLSLTAPAMAQSVIPALPKEMLGVWGFDAESCDEENSDTRMEVSSKEVEFYASSYDLKKIWRRANGSVKATATTSEEGEERKRRGAIELKLVSPGKLSVKTDSDLSHVYSRCKRSGKAGSLPILLAGATSMASARNNQNPCVEPFNKFIRELDDLLTFDPDSVRVVKALLFRYLPMKGCDVDAIIEAAKVSRHFTEAYERYASYTIIFKTKGFIVSFGLRKATGDIETPSARVRCGDKACL